MGDTIIQDIRNARKALAYMEQIDKGFYDYKE